MAKRYLSTVATSAAAAVGLTLSAPVAYSAPIGTTATWLFNLPSTAVASQTPPYPLVATLALTQTGDGVQFVLTPNWSGSNGFSDPSKIDYLDYVYQGSALTAGNVPSTTPPSTVGDFRWDGGAPIEEFAYVTNTHNMDSGYTTADQHIKVDFYTRNNDALFAFDKDYLSSTWTVLGADLIDFTDTEATSGPKPTPTMGVISVSAYSLTGIQPTPSNWVTGPGAGGDTGNVPEPGTLALVGLALAGIGFARRRN